MPIPTKVCGGQEWSDRECIGLRVIVSYSGRKTWYFRCTFRGQKLCLRLGEFPAISELEARTMVLEYKNKLARGIDPREDIQRQQEMPTLKEFCEREFFPHISARKKSYREDVQKLEKSILPELGNRPLTSITGGDVLRFIQRVKQRTSGATANRYLALLSGLFSFAIKIEILTKNPAKGIERYQESSGRERYLSDDEIARFITALKGSHSQLAALALMLLLATGMRKSESLTLPWDCVDLKRGYVKLEMQVTKGNRARLVVLNETAIRILEGLKSYRVTGNPYVFPGQKLGEHLVDLRKVFLTATRKAGIENCRIHDLRHTFCAKLASSGVSLLIIARLAGHRTLRTTERYSHLNDQCLRDATAIMGDQLNSTCVRVNQP